MEQNSIDRIFWDAAHIDSPVERKSFLAQACGGDARLRQKVEKLLEIRSQAEDFLESPLPAPLPMIDEPITERAGTVIGPSRASRCAQRPRRSGRCCSVP